MTTDRPQKELPELPARPKPGRFLLGLGMAATILYLAFVATYWRSNIGAFSTLPPNELGDFLAGVFAPLAFLWLVLGFLQQGQELRNSADALWLQGEELRHSVEQQRDLVNVTREQLQFESKMLEQQAAEIARNSQPILRLTQGGSTGSTPGKRLYYFTLFNHGKACTELAIHVENMPRPYTRPALASGGQMDINMELPADDVPAFFVEVTYLDERLLPGSRRFRVAGKDSVFKITDDEENREAQ